MAARSIDSVQCNWCAVVRGVAWRGGASTERGRGLLTTYYPYALCTARVGCGEERVARRNRTNLDREDAGRRTGRDTRPWENRAQASATVPLPLAPAPLGSPAGGRRQGIPPRGDYFRFSRRFKPKIFGQDGRPGVRRPHDVIFYVFPAESVISCHPIRMDSGIWWCEDEWMEVRDVTINSELNPLSGCVGKHAVVKAKSAVWRQFDRDVRQLRSLAFTQFDQLCDSEVVDFLRLLRSETETIKLSVELKQGFNVFYAGLENSISAADGIDALLVRVLVEVLAIRQILKKHTGSFHLPPVSGDVFWCEDDWTKVEGIHSGSCFGRHAVLLARNALWRQYKKDINALSNFVPTHILKDDEAIDCLHLLGSEPVKCTVTLQHRHNSFSAQWDVPTNSVVKSLRSACSSCDTVELEAILGRVLIEVLASERNLNKQHLSQIGTDVCLNPTTNELPDSPSSADTLVNEELAVDQNSNPISEASAAPSSDENESLWNRHQARKRKQSSALPNSRSSKRVRTRKTVRKSDQDRLLSTHENEGANIEAGVDPTADEPPDSPSSAVTLVNEELAASAGFPQEVLAAAVEQAVDQDSNPISEASAAASSDENEPFLNLLDFAEEEKVRIHDPLLEEPRDIDRPRTPTQNRRASPLANSRSPKQTKLTKLLRRDRIMAISLKEEGVRKPDKDRLLHAIETKCESISKLMGLRCNIDLKWSLDMLKKLIRCPKLHHVELLWPRREHWDLMQQLCFLRKLEIYADDELYRNPPTVNLPSTHAKRVQTIQAEGLHPTSLAALMQAHSGSLTRLEVLVDVPGQVSLPMDKPIGVKDGGRALSDAELRSLLEYEPTTASQEQQETKLVRLALRKLRNLGLSIALPVSMFPRRGGRRVGSGRAGPRRRARHEARLFCEYSVPVEEEEDCRRYPNLKSLILLRPTSVRHNAEACKTQISTMRRKWPNMVIINCNNCDDKEKKKVGRQQRGKRLPKNRAAEVSLVTDKKNYFYFYRSTKS